MNKTEIIRKIEEYVRNNIKSHDGGHDWWHISRVRDLSLFICKGEGKGDLLTVEISALLHDIGDQKFREYGASDHIDLIRALLGDLQLETALIEEVIFINNNISYSKGARPEVVSPEFMAVQDADRIDAIGAIGIARAFNFGGFKNNCIYDPEGIQPSTVAHFYDKLLKLIDHINTETGRQIAMDRHKYLESYLIQFYKEWNGPL